MSSEFAIVWMAVKNDDEQRKILFLELAQRLGLMNAIREHYPQFNEKTVIEFREIGHPNDPIFYDYNNGALTYWQQFGVTRKSMDQWQMKSTEYRITLAYVPKINRLFVDERGVLEYE